MSNNPAGTRAPLGLVALLSVALRMLMGIGESTFYPSALSLLSQRVQPSPRPCRSGPGNRSTPSMSVSCRRN